MHVTVGLRRRIARQTQHRAELTPETLIVALDLGKRQHAVWVTDSTRVPLGTWMMPETLIVALDLGKRWPLFSPAMLFRGTGTRT